MPSTSDVMIVHLTITRSDANEVTVEVEGEIRSVSVRLPSGRRAKFFRGLIGPGQRLPSASCSGTSVSPLFVQTSVCKSHVLIINELRVFLPRPPMESGGSNSLWTEDSISLTTSMACKLPHPFPPLRTKLRAQRWIGSNSLALLLA